MSRVALGERGNEVVLKAPAPVVVLKESRPREGTAVEGAQLHIDLRTDATNPHAQEILLESVHVEV